MRSDVGVVEESEMEPSLEVLLEKGLKGAKAQVVFECFPKSFDECDGAGFADGAETVLDTKVNEKLSEPRVGELGTLVGDKVPRRAEPTARRSRRASDISEEGSAGKTEPRGHSREGVKNNGDLEMKETEQTGDVGQVSQPDVVGVASEYGPPCRWPNGWRQCFCGGASFRILRTVSRESFQPARARVWAMSWLPPKPTSAMV